MFPEDEPSLHEDDGNFTINDSERIQRITAANLVISAIFKYLSYKVPKFNEILAAHNTRATEFKKTDAGTLIYLFRLIGLSN